MSLSRRIYPGAPRFPVSTGPASGRSPLRVVARPGARCAPRRRSALAAGLTGALEAVHDRAHSAGLSFDPELSAHAFWVLALWAKSRELALGAPKIVQAVACAERRLNEQLEQPINVQGSRGRTRRGLFAFPPRVQGADRICSMGICHPPAPCPCAADSRVDRYHAGGDRGTIRFQLRFSLFAGVSSGLWPFPRPLAAAVNAGERASTRHSKRNALTGPGLTVSRPWGPKIEMTLTPRRGSSS